MTKWRNTCPDVLLTRIGEGYDAQLYLLRQTGPTGFLLKEHDSDRKFKVLLGLQHACDCSLFLKDQELCSHILWILTRKFRLAKDDPLVYQLGLNERELNNIIYRPKQSDKKVVTKVASAGNDRVIEKKKDIESDDVCPICQEDIYHSKKSLIHCKFGCGNSIHVYCMKIWADHQLKSLNEDIIKCPLCRTEFSSHHNIVKEYSRAKAKEKSKVQRQSHFCNGCKLKLTLGHYYRCSVCKNVFLCSNCFQANYHSDHSFEYRSSVHEKWNTAIRHGISLAPNVLRFDSNHCRSPVDQNRSGHKNKSVERIQSRVIKSANPNSLPDLSLGISGINLQSPANLSADNKKMKSNFHLPPLPNSGNSDSVKIHGKIRSKKCTLRREQSLPSEGISGIISVSSLQQLRANNVLSG